MTLQELFQAVDRLSPNEQNELRNYLNRLQNDPSDVMSPAERAQRLDAAFDAFRIGLDDATLDEIVNAMNDDYIEPIGDDGFPLL